MPSSPGAGLEGSVVCAVANLFGVWPLTQETRFELLALLSMKLAAFWYVTPCSEAADFWV